MTSSSKKNQNTAREDGEFPVTSQSLLEFCINAPNPSEFHEELAFKYFPPIKRYLDRTFHPSDRDLLESMANMAVMQLIKKLDKYEHRDGCKFRTWVIKLVHNVGLNELHAHNRMKVKHPTVPIELATLAEREEGCQATREILEDIESELSETQYQEDLRSLRACVFEDKSMQQIAQERGMSYGAFRKRIERMRRFVVATVASLDAKRE